MEGPQLSGTQALDKENDDPRIPMRKLAIMGIAWEQPLKYQTRKKTRLPRPAWPIVRKVIIINNNKIVSARSDNEARMNKRVMII
jgi:hypothetical protein